MEIILDISSMVTPHLTGVGVYEQNLVQGLLEYDSTGQVSPIIRANKWGKKSFLHKHLTQKEFGKVQTFTVFDDLLSHSNSIFHGPDCKLIAHGRQKKIITIHDLQPFYPEWWNEPSTPLKMKNDLTRLIHRKLDAIIVPTKTIKDEIHHFFPHLNIPIEVIYHGCDQIQFTSDIATPQRFEQLKTSNFILCLGTIENRKNQNRLIKAYYQLCQQQKIDHKLVIAGGNGHGADELLKSVSTEIEFLKKHDLIFFAGRVDNLEKNWLYHNCSFFIYPSLYEGFGIPLIEAMKAKKVIVTSNVGAMAEICQGPSAILVNPKSELEIVNGILNGIKVCKLETHWDEHLKKFNWKKSVEKHMYLYSQLSK